MIIITSDGAFSNASPLPSMLFGPAELETLQQAIDDALRTRDKVTIEELYNEYFQDDLYMKYNMEVFVDPSMYGWDKNGFRRLYKPGPYKVEV